VVAGLADALRIFVPVLSGELPDQIVGALQRLDDGRVGAAGEPLDDVHHERIVSNPYLRVSQAGGKAPAVICPHAWVPVWVSWTSAYRIAALNQTKSGVHPGPASKRADQERPT